MAIIDMNSENLNDDGPSEEQLLKSREERKRTGRYVAAGTAIFLSLLGIYQALLNGTPEYAALFAPAVIMFIYVLWILHASRNQTARLLRFKAVMAARAEEMENFQCEIPIQNNDNEKNLKIANNLEQSEEATLLQKESDPEKQSPTNLEKESYCNRSYSIA